MGVNFEDAIYSFGTFREAYSKDHFSDGSGGMNAICSPPEVADDVMFGKDVDTFRFYAIENLLVIINAIFSSFRENLNQPFM